MLAFDRALFERDWLAFDRASSKRTFDADGRMHVDDCNISKANVCPYHGREIPNFRALGLAADSVYMLYRAPEELEKAVGSFRNAQLLMLHAKVNAKDSKQHITVGTVGTDISFDGTYLKTSRLTVWDKKGIDAVESEEQAELSSSYYFRAEMKAGRTPEGVAYDGVMRDIKANHVALVRKGRAGSDVAVCDSFPLEPSSMKFANILAVLAPYLVTGVDLLAADAALCKAAEDENMEDDPENPGKKRKKINPGKGEPTKPGGALASDAQIDAAIVAKGYVTAAAAQQMANDAATAASADAVSKVNALHAAREAVKPLVGIVAMDSADAVYEFALKQSGVALDGVPVAAYPALISQVVARKSAAPVPAKATIAADSASVASAALPGLGRINIA